MDKYAIIYKYFIETDHNCAESTLLAANEIYELGLSDEDVKLVSGFGAGMGCEGVCGALCGAMAALSKMKVEGRAHATPGFGPLCAGLVKKFEEATGNVGVNCAQLKPIYRKDDGLRCIKTVELAIQALDEYLQEI